MSRPAGLALFVLLLVAFSAGTAALFAGDDPAAPAQRHQPILSPAELRETVDALAHERAKLRQFHQQIEEGRDVLRQTHEVMQRADELLGE